MPKHNGINEEQEEDKQENVSVQYKYISVTL